MMTLMISLSPLFRYDFSVLLHEGRIILERTGSDGGHLLIAFEYINLFGRIRAGTNDNTELPGLFV